MEQTPLGSGYGTLNLYGCNLTVYGNTVSVRAPGDVGSLVNISPSSHNRGDSYGRPANSGANFNRRDSTPDGGAEDECTGDPDYADLVAEFEAARLQQGSTDGDSNDGNGSSPRYTDHGEVQDGDGAYGDNHVRPTGQQSQQQPSSTPTTAHRANDDKRCKYDWHHIRSFRTLDEAKTFVTEGVEAIEGVGGKEVKATFRYVGGHNRNTGMYKLYRCASHDECTRHVCVKYSLKEYILAPPDQAAGAYHVYGANVHARELSAPDRGVAPALYRSVEKQTAKGLIPTEIVSKLVEKVGPDKRVPSVEQVKAVARTVSRREAGNVSINNAAELARWADIRRAPTDAADFNNLLLDQLVTFGANFDDVEGFVFGSRRLMQRMVQAVLLGSSLLWATDGTYKFHNEGWPLLHVGTHARWINPKTGKAVHRYQVGLFMFTRSESTAAFRRLFLAIAWYMKDVLSTDMHDLQLVVIADNSDQIQGAATACFPNVILLNDWAHLARKLRVPLTIKNQAIIEQRQRVQAWGHALHGCVNEVQFDGMFALSMEDLRQHGYDDDAAWLTKEYGQAQNKGWFLGASG
eukprot:GHVU01155726.1.p1 GENE.GHVU01155726.1~~GHVU01155726.1.p1  ORF type:complete len:576 (-),score=73.87 GHVU01155726.1:79-1806(-)